MKVHELLATPDKWAQGYYAFDASGFKSSEFAEKAHSFCLVGALSKCYDALTGGPEAEKALYKRIGNLVAWNDNPERTHAEVLALVKELDI